MPKLSATARITLGLASIMTSLLMIAAMLGMYPDVRNTTAQGRKDLCESLAINFSLMATRADTGTMRKTLAAITGRNSDILSMGVRREDGTLMIDVGEHEAHWPLAAGDRSTESDLQVEIMARDKPWGTVEIRFQPISASGPVAVLTRPEFTHIGFVVSLGVLAYYLYLSKVLHHLNPSKVVPNRVREALDTLAEGLLVLDRDERIVLANRAFEKSTGAHSDELIGRPIHQ